MAASRSSQRKRCGNKKYAVVTTGKKMRKAAELNSIFALREAGDYN